MYEVCYSIDGKLKEVLFSMEDDAKKFYNDILKKNKANKDFEYINLTQLKLIGHYHRPGGMMRG